MVTVAMTWRRLVCAVIGHRSRSPGGPIWILRDCSRCGRVLELDTTGPGGR